MNEILRGQIYMCDLGNVESSTGNLQRGKRPCLVISNNQGNKYSNIVTVIPLTSKLTKRPLPTHVKLTPNETNKLKCESVLLCEHTVTVNKTQLSFLIGSCCEVGMKRVEKAIMVSLGLVA